MPDICITLPWLLFAFVLPLPGETPRPLEDGQQQFGELGVCKLTSGQAIKDCRLGYRTWGKLNSQGSNAVLFPTWFSGSSKSIEALVGAGKLVDSAKYFVIAVDALGDGVSSSPSNSTAQARLQFPAFTIADMVYTEYRLLTEKLLLTHLRAVLAYRWAACRVLNGRWPIRISWTSQSRLKVLPGSQATTYSCGTQSKQRLRPIKPGEAAITSSHRLYLLFRALQQMNLTTPSYYARAHPSEKFAADYAEYGVTGIAPFDANDWLYQLGAMVHLDVAKGEPSTTRQSGLRPTCWS